MPDETDDRPASIFTYNRADLALTMEEGRSPRGGTISDDDMRALRAMLDRIDRSGVDYENLTEEQRRGAFAHEKKLLSGTPEADAVERYGDPLTAIGWITMVVALITIAGALFGVDTTVMTGASSYPYTSVPAEVVNLDRLQTQELIYEAGWALMIIAVIMICTAKVRSRLPK